MDEFENMKAMWMELNNRITLLEEENRILARKVMNQNFISARQKLIRKYTIFSIISFIMLVYILLFVNYNPELVEELKVPTAIYWCLFFIFEATGDLYLRYRTKKIDIYNSNVRDITIQAGDNWKLHKLLVAIGLPLAVGAIILFGFLVDGNIFIIYGMMCGGVVGLIIGFRQLLSFRGYYRLLQSEEGE